MKSLVVLVNFVFLKTLELWSLIIGVNVGCGE